jgi:hypothetical protein
VDEVALKQVRTLHASFITSGTAPVFLGTCKRPCGEGACCSDHFFLWGLVFVRIAVSVLMCGAPLHVIFD